MKDQAEGSLVSNHSRQTSMQGNSTAPYTQIRRAEVKRQRVLPDCQTVELPWCTVMRDEAGTQCGSLQLSEVLHMH